MAEPFIGQIFHITNEAEEKTAFEVVVINEQGVGAVIENMYERVKKTISDSLKANTDPAQAVLSIMRYPNAIMKESGPDYQKMIESVLPIEASPNPRKI